MKRQIRWSLLMAVLGFILGLGWLLPLPSAETSTEARAPASVAASALRFSVANLESVGSPIDENLGSKNDKTALMLPYLPPKKDYRADVLFDVHTIARGVLSKNTDAYVGVLFLDRATKAEIKAIYFCHNYDFDKQKANARLNRYEIFDEDRRFPCVALPLAALKNGITLISAGALGAVLTFASEKFDAKSGGTVTAIFAHKLAKFSKNTYRRMDMKITLTRRGAKVTGPEGESFSWINLKMSEDVLNIPTGVQGFELLSSSKVVKKYSAEDFPREIKHFPRESN